MEKLVTFPAQTHSQWGTLINLTVVLAVWFPKIK